MKTLRWPSHPPDVHVRTCQECGHTQTSIDPAGQKSNAWRHTKCRKCKSEGSLDYGSTNLLRDDDDCDCDCMDCSINGEPTH